MNEKENDNYYRVVTAKDLSKMFNLGVQRIRQLSADRTLPWIDNDPQYLYYNGEAVKAYVESLKKKIADKDILANDNDLNERKLLADVLRAEHDAKIKENHAELTRLQLEEYKGNLHPSEDVRDAMTQIVMTAKQGIISLHGKLGIKIAQKLHADPAVCIDLVREAEEEILTELFEHQYDEKFFKDRAHERKLEEEMDRVDHGETA